jgi:hypothetical protein
MNKALSYSLAAVIAMAISAPAFAITPIATPTNEADSTAISGSTAIAGAAAGAVSVSGALANGGNSTSTANGGTAVAAPITIVAPTLNNSQGQGQNQTATATTGPVSSVNDNHSAAAGGSVLASGNSDIHLTGPTVTTVANPTATSGSTSAGGTASATVAPITNTLTTGPSTSSVTGVSPTATAAASNNGNGSNNTEIDFEATKRAAATAVAPSVFNNGTCAGSGASLAFQAPGFGASGGFGKTDEHCERRATAGMMDTLGQRTTALKIMCLEADVRKVAPEFCDAGFPVPAPKVIYKERIVEKIVQVPAPTVMAPIANPPAVFMPVRVKHFRKHAAVAACQKVCKVPTTK